MKILIIEDEKYTAKDLAHTIRAVEPSAEILPFIHSVEDGWEFLQQGPDIDLIFSDIDLGDGLSFELFEKVNIHCPIIFCTAYEQYALQVLQHFGIDYILKPFQKSHIERALLRYKGLKEKFEKTSATYQQIGSMLNHPQPSRSLLVHVADRIIPLPVSDIALIYTENNLVYAFTLSQKKYVLSETLEVLEQTLPGFFRANRQYLVSQAAIKDASQYFNRKLRINLTVEYPDEIIVSRLKVHEFLRWLSNSPY